MNISILGMSISIEMLILIGIVYLIIIVNTVSSCCNTHGGMEGFVGANTNYGESSRYSLNNNKPINTSSWSQPNLTITPGQPLSSGVQNLLNRPQQQLPLPEGQLSMFANTPFKPECCPNTYSNSMGCACMTVGQYDYLITRGGNNVPYSEY